MSLIKTNGYRIMIRLYEWLHQKLPRLIDCRSINTKKIVEESGFKMHDNIELTMWGLPVDIHLAGKT